MTKDNASAEAAAILRRDAPGKPGPGSNCPRCGKTTLSVSPDEHGDATHDPTCPACGYEA